MLHEIYKSNDANRAEFLLTEFRKTSKFTCKEYLEIVRVSDDNYKYRIAASHEMKRNTAIKAIRFFEKMDSENPFSHVDWTYRVTCKRTEGTSLLEKERTYQVKSIRNGFITIEIFDGRKYKDCTYMFNRFYNLVEDLPF